MLRAMFLNICHRPSCYDSCVFKKQYRISDFTIWDCFVTNKFTKNLDDKGTTRVLIHTKKGIKIFNDIKNKVNYERIDINFLTKDVKELNTSVEMNYKRIGFVRDLQVLNGDELFNKYFRETLKIKTERIIRRLSAKLGIYSFIRSIYNKLK